MRKWKICLFLITLALFLPGVTKSLAAQSAAHKDTLPEGIPLPKSGVVFALDAKAKGKELIQIHPSELAWNPHAAGNVARQMVYVGPRSTVELVGLNSATSLQDANAFFYIRYSSDDAELLRRRVHLIRMQQNKENRVLLTFAQNIFRGQRTKKFDDVPITKSDAEPDVWLKITPSVPLVPGEYCIVFMPQDVSSSPDVIYDFNIGIEAAKVDQR